MKNNEILKYVDHTLLKAVSTWEQIKKICEETRDYNMASACIPPTYVEKAAKDYGNDIVICTVLGFPLGYDNLETKVFSAKNAILKGAEELDMVINIGDVKNRDYDKITYEITKMKEAVGSKILKVIIETCYLEENEKIQLCKCVTDGGADYIKTSTGFGTAGATIKDIILLKNHIGPNVKIKASGGIKTKSDLVSFIEIGCQRLGTSSALQILYG
ncbi:deoxyribose-phosphate aldolase [Miniphocaeibacter halophilus]|uniref:Deoxyribose-phosphate aldolase n=1 Tax=Miniphocaeibacter halophilus TaxID=2931922 RepID=A0AC61MWG3_9FIRM|nr:deoxyribose-phosphate aldolase [Miniphocaeibacter halophilus]QQK07253.1 deoxyribose-phosphate aldolase [Miniphocaeibacter halophilus]